MKGKLIVKRTLSLALCIVMLISCWVFTAPTANATDYTGPSDTVGNQVISGASGTIPSLTDSENTNNGIGTYKVRLLICEDRTNSAYYAFDSSVHDDTTYTAGIVYASTTAQTKAASLRNLSGTSKSDDVTSGGNTYWCEWAQICYKNMNGTGEEGAVWFNIGDKDAKGRSSIISSTGRDGGYFPREEGLLIHGFPTKFTTRYYNTTSGWFEGNGAGYFAYLQVAYWNGSKWVWTNAEGGNGTLDSGKDFKNNTSYKSGIATEHFLMKSGDSGAELKLSNIAVPDAQYPAASSTPTVAYRTSTTATTNTTTATCPTTSSTTTSMYLNYSCKDKYGVEMVSNITTKTNQNVASGFEQVGKQTKIKYGANVPGTTNSQTFTATVTWPQKVTSSQETVSTSLTVSDATYSVTFKNNGTKITQSGFTNPQTISYGCNATPPTGTYTKPADASYHYTRNGWETYTNITATTTVNAKYNSVGHTWNYTNNGTTHRKYCTVCNYDTDLTALSHTYDKSIVDDAYLKSIANCTTKATYYKSCICGASSQGDTNTTFTTGAINADNHNYEEGWTSDATNHWHKCTRNASHITGEAAHSWTYVSNGVGSHKKVCSVCEYVGEATMDHTFATRRVNEVAATCTAAGSYDLQTYCSDCNQVISTATGNVIPSPGHTWGDWSVTTAAVAPTCTVNGTTAVETHTCSVCGATETRGGAVDPATGHNSDGAWHYDDTNHWNECTNGCGTHLNQSGHSYTTTVTTQPTCSTTGVRTYTCTCGRSYTETIAKLAHTPADSVIENNVAATCTTAGGYDVVVYCSVCSNEITRTPVNIPAPGHSWGDWADNGDGTKTTHTRTCGVCGAVDTGSHNYTTTTTAPTCTAQGYTTYTCGTCSFFYDGNFVPATGHNTAGQSWQTDGSNHWKVCLTCSAEVGKTGHSGAAAVQENRVEATCTEAGSYNNVIYCSVCARKLSTTPVEIPAAGHSWSAYTTTDPAEHTRTCSVCGANDTDDHEFTSWSSVVAEGNARLSAAMDPAYDSEEQCYRYCPTCYRVEYRDHTYNAVVSPAPTCTTDGTKTHTCTSCNKSYSETVAALGHDAEHAYRDYYASVGNGIYGAFVFRCPRCDVILSAEYDTENKEWVVDSDDENASTEIDVSNEQAVVCPTFNTFVDNSIIVGYNDEAKTQPVYLDYASKPASMRIETAPLPEAGADESYKQALRFCGATRVPNDVGFCDAYDYFIANVTKVEGGKRTVKSPAELAELVDDPAFENCILDFGFVYTQESVCRNEKVEFDWDTDFVIGTPGVYQMSVIKNNAAKASYSTWKGYTNHNANSAYVASVASQKNLDTGYYLTYNLVINVSAKNWNKRYEARTYITYIYQGQIYTVYDKVYDEGDFNMSERSVLGYCINVYALCEEQESTDNATARYIDNRLNWWCESFVDRFNEELAAIEEDPIDAEEYRNWLSCNYYYDLEESQRAHS